ncbi:hypothetical protein C0581_05055 [Candidatus Parcubacteria bacterium]|nr:MAG: hypothetical protein C0581_05055 [Candidatus Parcubacteria bacterium]
MKSSIQKLMWNNVGIIRKEENMKKTLEELNKYNIELKEILNDGINKEILELKNLHTVAKLITQSALDRKESVGTHFLVT